MQYAIVELMKLGQFPCEESAGEDHLFQTEKFLAQIKRPVSDDEARALTRLFGPDECYCLAWSLLHHIETAPGWPLEDVLNSSSHNEWIVRLKRRVENARKERG